MTPTSFPLLRRRAGIAALALSVTLLACSSDSDATGPDAGVGRFSAVVSAASQTSLAGLAGLISLPATGPDSTTAPASVIIVLQDQATTAQLGFEWFGTDSLALQTYPVGPADSDIAMGYIDATGTVFNGTSGSVTITSVANGVVSGSFSGTATSADTASRTVSVSGTFKATTVTQ